MENLDAAIGKAVDQAGAAPSGQADPASIETPSNENGNKAAADKVSPETTAGAAKAATKAVWDGNINSLSEELQEKAKEMQRYVTKHTTEAAELRRKVQDYEGRFTADKVTAFERWQEEQARPKADAAPSITQEEWEDALLDPTGQTMNKLLQRQTKYEVGAARAAVMKEMADAKKQQDEHMALQQRVADFASLNPEFKKLNDLGLLMPVLRHEIEKGGTLESAYEATQKIVNDIKGLRDAELTELATKKKDATTLNGKSASEDHVVWVDTNDQAIEAQIEAAISKKPIKVRIRPKK